MSKSRWLGLGTAVVVLMLGTPQARAVPVPEGASPLTQIPASAPIVIQLKGIEGSKDRLLQFLSNAAPDFAPLIKLQVNAALEDGIEGRKFQGLAANGPIFLIFTELPDPNQDTPAVAILARITNYQEFRDGWLKEDERKALRQEKDYEVTLINNETAYFIDKGTYVLVTPQKKVADLFNSPFPTLDAKLDKGIAERFLNADLSAYVDVRAIHKEYGPQIQFFLQLMQTFMEQDNPGLEKLDKAQVQMVKGIMRGIAQVITDSQAVVVGVNARPEGLALYADALFGKDTDTNQMLKTFQPAALSELGELPQGLFGYTATKYAPAAHQLLTLSLGLLGSDDNEEVRKALDALIAAQPEVGVQGAGLPMRGLTVQRFANPRQAVAAQLQLLQVLPKGSQYMSGVTQGKPEIKENAENYRDIAFNYVRVVWDIDKMVAQQGDELPEDIKKIMTKLYTDMLGQEMNIWFGTDGKRVYQVIAADWKDAQQRLDQFFAGTNTLSQQDAYREARQQLPAETTMLALYESGQFAQLISNFLMPIMKELMGVNIPEVRIRPGKPSYMGMALTLQSQRGGVDFWLPAGAVSEFRKVIEPIIQAAPGAVPAGF
ncbi:MAG: hypothetical protein ACK4RK_13190 [Gemmataceae bacterium]